MAHQVLCIQTGWGTAEFKPKKGDICNSIGITQAGVKYNNVDAWHLLEEGAYGDIFHVSMFVDLPNQEGQSFSKKVDEPVEIEKEELVEQD